MLIHAGFYDGKCLDGYSQQCCTIRSGGLAYSEDGVNWVRSPIAPFSNAIKQADGTTWTTSTRERPKLYFDASGAPAALFSGVTGGDPHTQSGTVRKRHPPEATLKLCILPITATCHITNLGPPETATKV